VTVITKASHFIALEDLKEWIESYGLILEDCKHASIEIGYQHGPEISAWLEVEFIKRNGAGKPYGVRGPSGETEIATGLVSVPLHSWPKLSAIASAPEDG
jgi:hypothetical protein